MKYRAVCFRCYSCHLTQPTTKKAAQIAAVSHMNSYHHETAVHEVEPAKKEKETA